MLPTQFGAPPPAPVLTTPRRRGRVALALATSVALVGGAAFAGSLAFDGGPLHPERWDPRVADLAGFVERTRGLKFEHPVHVYFLTEQEYSDISGGGVDAPDPTDEEREASAAGVAEYRALGLMEGDPDLLAANEALQDSGTLAFYSPDDDVVNVRGRKMTVGLRVTLVHELTHALQDQHFDLTPVGDASTPDESGAARSIVEGDAVSVENEYVAQLSEADRVEYETELDGEASAADAGLGDVPDVLQVLFGSYYAVGNAFVDYWQATPGGEPLLTRIDPVLRRLPTSSAQLFEPTLYTQRLGPASVPPPEPPDIVEDFEVSTFGADLLFVMLAERIDPSLALRATDGWRGDGYRAGWTEDDRRLCVAATVELATWEDGTEFHEAMVAWAKAMPIEAHVEVPEQTGRSITFRTCDPGPATTMGLTGRAGDALVLPVARLHLAAQAVTDGRSRVDALCYATQTVSRLSVDDLTSDSRPPALDAAFVAADAIC